jgi:hypothetical protein
MFLFPASRLSMDRYTTDGSLHEKWAVRNHSIPTRQETTHSAVLTHSITSLAEVGQAIKRAIKNRPDFFSVHTFFSLLTKIKCNICSYQSNI